MDGAVVEDGVPPETPSSVPVQNLRRFSKSTRRIPTRPGGRLSSLVARVLVMGGTVALAGFAIYEMDLVLKVDGLTIVELLVLALFAISTLWIALPFMTALLGLARLAMRRRKGDGVHRLSSRTAILQPVYNEDPARVAAALDAMGHSLLALHEGHSFDVFILSDTTDAAVALAEQESVWTLRRRLRDGLRVYYRRRLRNTAHKAGNIRDFCQR